MKLSDFQREHCITLDATVDDTLQAALLHERDTPRPMYYKKPLKLVIPTKTFLKKKARAHNVHPVKEQRSE